MAEERTTIPSDWKMTTLSNVIEIIDGDRGSNYPQNDEFLSDGYCLFLNTKNVPGKTFSFKENKFINEEKNLKLGKGKLKRYDFVLTTRGTIGNFAFYSEKAPFENIRINSGMVILRTKEGILTNNFFKFYLRSYLFSNQAKSLSSGTAQPQLPIKDLKCFQIILPPCLEQDAIASVLSSLDDKIELLNEQSKTLETTSQTIFKEWFVNFNFPGATGKMIDSELGKIPQGWRCGKIKDLVDILSGFAFLSSDFSQNGKYKLVTIKNVQDRHFVIGTKDRLSKLPLKMPDHCKLDSGSILLSLTGNVGRVCLTIGENFLLNQRVAKLKAKDPVDYAFTYLLFLQNSTLSLLQNTASGTAQQNLSPIQTKEIKIIISDRKTLDKFGMVTNKLIQKINTNNSQIQTLSTLRDTLLSKLMKGEVRAKGFSN